MTFVYLLLLCRKTCSYIHSGDRILILCNRNRKKNWKHDLVKAWSLVKELEIKGNKICQYKTEDYCYEDCSDQFQKLIGMKLPDVLKILPRKKSGISPGYLQTR